MSNIYGPRIVTDGLVLCLDAGNRKSYPGSGTTWYDLSGKNNHGNFVNNIVFSNNYFIFDGINSRIDLGDLDISPPYSFSIWFKGFSTQKGFIGLLNKSSTNGFGDWGLYGDSASSYVRFGFQNTLNQQKEVSNLDYKDIKNNIWVNYIGTYDFLNLKLYRNSLEIASSPEETIPITSNFIANIGARASFSTTLYNFSGLISNVSIYSKALDSKEIQQNYNALKGRFGL